MSPFSHDSPQKDRPLERLLSHFFALFLCPEAEEVIAFHAEVSFSEVPAQIYYCYMCSVYCSTYYKEFLAPARIPELDPPLPSLASPHFRARFQSLPPSSSSSSPSDPFRPLGCSVDGDGVSTLKKWGSLYVPGRDFTFRCLGFVTLHAFFW